MAEGLGNEKYRYPAGLRWLIVIVAGVFIYIKAGAFTGNSVPNRIPGFDRA